MKIKGVLSVLILSLLSLAAFADSGLGLKLKTVRELDPRQPLFTFSFGNDLFGIQPKTENNLTNYLTVGFVTEQIPDAIQKIMDDNEGAMYSVTASQYIYTPTDKIRTDINPDDRPYAGFLFVRLQAARRENGEGLFAGRDILLISGIEAGVYGPLSGAEQMQKIVHKLTGSTTPNGWDHQLRNELGVNIYKMGAVNWRRDTNNVDVEGVVHAAGTLGTVNTHGELGVLLRLGYNIPDDMAASFYSPNDIAAGGTRTNIAPVLKSLRSNNLYGYVFAGADGRCVVRDASLDGNLFRSSHSVSKKPCIGDYYMGFVVGYKGFTFGYMDKVISETFDGQSKIKSGHTGPGSSHNGVLFFEYQRQF